MKNLRRGGGYQPLKKDSPVSLVPPPSGTGITTPDDATAIHLDVAERDATITVIHRSPDSKWSVAWKTSLAWWALFFVWQLINDGKLW